MRVRVRGAFREELRELDVGDEAEPCLGAATGRRIAMKTTLIEECHLPEECPPPHRRPQAHRGARPVAPRHAQIHLAARHIQSEPRSGFSRFQDSKTVGMGAWPMLSGPPLAAPERHTTLGGPPPKPGRPLAPPTVPSTCRARCHPARTPSRNVPPTPIQSGLGFGFGT